ncbi:MAG TPA: DUF1684 domain-containing protein [Opitutaceae bacterium]
MLRFLLPLLMLTGVTAFAADDYVRSIETWRDERRTALTAPESWLSLIGLHALAPGAQTVGSGADNAVRLRAGPERLGTLTLAPDRMVTFEVASGVQATIGGQTVARGALTYTAEATTIVRFGTASFIVIDRGGSLYLRVRDSETPRRRDFVGIDYFPIDPKWKIEAQWVPFEPVRQVPITNILGQTGPQPSPGKAVFTHEGRTIELVAVDEGAENELFFILTDLTAGEETYGAARFLYTTKPKDGRLVLDFNRTENPPCAFNPYSTCPLPPKENRLPFRLEAGEKMYRGVH